jgi:O-antigen ligase
VGVKLLPGAAAADTPASAAGRNGHEAPSPSGPRPGTAYLLTFAGMATVGFNTVRAGGWSVSDLLFLAAVGIVVLHLLTGRRRQLAPPEVRRSAPIVVLGTLVLLVGGTLSSFWAFDPLGSMSIVLRYAWLTLVWFWALRAVSPTATHVARLATAYKVTVAISAVAAIVGDVGILQVSPDLWSGRQAAFFGHPNSLAGLLVVGVPLFVLDVPRPPGKPHGRSLVYRLVTTGILVIAIGTTGSMTGMLGTVVAVAVIGVVSLVAQDDRRRRRNPLTVMALVAAGGMAVFAFVQSDSAVVERFTEWRAGDSAVSTSVDSRDAQRDIVLQRLDERLVLGVGFDKAATLVDSGDDTLAVSGGVHNMYLKLIYEAGFVAFAGLLMITVATLQRAWRLVLHTRGTPLYALSLALLASFAAAISNALFQPILVRRYYWMPVALIWALWSIVRYEASRRNGSGTRGDALVR